MSKSALPADTLAPSARKYVDPSSKLETRMMAAKALVPMPAADQIKALQILSFDSEDEVASTALETAKQIPDNVLTPALRGAQPPAVLDFLGRCLVGRPQQLELILLNPSTPDETFAYLAKRVDEKTLTIIADNQLRLLRHHDIIRGIDENPNTSASLRDKVFDFAVRSGVEMPDLASFQEARRRILGAAAEEPVAREQTAEGLLELHKEDLADDLEEEEEIEEEKRHTLSQKVLMMTVSEKIKLANRGNKEARTLLLRDPNKLVQEAAVQSPRITEAEIVALTNSRTIPDEILRIIMRNRDWMKSYQVKVNLINNPKTPVPTAIRLLPHMRASDLRGLSRNRNVPNAVSTQAKNLLQKKSGGGGV